MKSWGLSTIENQACTICGNISRQEFVAKSGGQNLSQNSVAKSGGKNLWQNSVAKSGGKT